MKEKRFLLFLLLSICFTLGLKCNVLADTYTGDGYTLAYSVKNNTISITDCTESATKVVIPKMINNVPVTSINDYAFTYCKSLTNITIPNSITSIGRKAFYYCESLTNITIPNSVTSIGEEAFEFCESLTNITIPNGITSINNSSFEFCESLTNITIPNSVTSIGDSAFSHCKSLTNITIPNSVTSIGNFAFDYCESLTNITIPNSVTSIMPRTFRNCESLTSITIPDSVTSIGEYAFYCCPSLTSITIPNSVTSIGNYAFGYTGTSIIDRVNGLIIYSTFGSQAERYAKINNITFIDKSHTNHTYSAWVVTQPATIYSTGSQTRTCTICGASQSETIPKLQSSNVSSNNYYSTEGHIYIDSDVYSKTTKVKLSTWDAQVGDKVTLTIGKKTYKTTVNGKGWVNLLIKIKKPKAKQKIVARLYRNGQLISTDTGYVCISKNPKKGMSKNTVKKYTSWGEPSDTGTASDGWSYWYYNSGSSITFKNGKVRYWYKAN